MLHLLLVVLACARSVRAAGGFSAEFTLAEGVQGATTLSAGTLTLASAGEAYAEVRTPLAQRIWLKGDGMTLWYPAEGKAVRAPAARGSLPPVFDAVAAAVLDPVILARGARLVGRSREGRQLVTRWERDDSKGRALGGLLVTEDASWVLNVEVLDAAGRPQARYAFRRHVRVGDTRVPREIEARYEAGPEGARRVERWTLSRVRPPDPAAAAQLDGPPRLPPGTAVRTLRAG